MGIFYSIGRIIYSSVLTRRIQKSRPYRPLLHSEHDKIFSIVKKNYKTKSIYISVNEFHEWFRPTPVSDCWTNW